MNHLKACELAMIPFSAPSHPPLAKPASQRTSPFTERLQADIILTDCLQFDCVEAEDPTTLECPLVLPSNCNDGEDGVSMSLSSSPSSKES